MAWLITWKVSGIRMDEKIKAEYVGLDKIKWYGYIKQGGLREMKSFDRTCDAIKVHGVTYFEGIGYGRVPLETADTISKDVSGMAMRSTGGRFRFVTNTHKLRMTVRVAEVKRSRL